MPIERAKRLSDSLRETCGLIRKTAFVTNCTQTEFTLLCAVVVVQTDAAGVAVVVAATQCCV